MSDRSEPHNPPRPNPVRPAALDAAARETSDDLDAGAREVAAHAAEIHAAEIHAAETHAAETHAAEMRPAHAHAAPHDAIPLLEPERPVVRAVASSPTRAEVDDHASPCDGCGYDLRGRPGGGVCPECGRRIPRRIGHADGADGAGGASFGASLAGAWGASGGASSVRENASLGWRGLAVASLAPIGLLTPIPSNLSLGVPIAVALGFAPVFRLHGLGRIRTLPDAIVGPFRAEFGRMRRIQIVELVFVGAIVLYGAAGTFASIPAALLPLYRALILAWWMVAIEGVGLQLRLGHAFAQTLVDPSVLPSVARPLRAVRVAQLLLLAGALLIAVTSFTPVGSAAIGNAAWLLALLCILAAAVTGGYACLMAYGHAGLVAECIFEAEALRPKRSARVANDLRLNEFKSPPPSAPPPPRADGRPHWDDDEPMPLA